MSQVTQGAARRAARRVHRALVAYREDLWQPPGHYYSPISSAEDRRRALTWSHIEPVGLDLRPEEQLALARRQAPLWADVTAGPRWHPGNQMYELGDAAVLHGMLRDQRPRRVVEVGSGFSTAVMLDAADRFDTTRDITCVEPYPQRLMTLCGPEDVTLIRQGVQDVPIDLFTSLEPGDLLFIDSTHVVKAGSDVVWLYLQVLPRLSPGVLVHIHDVVWPFTYFPAWIEEGRDWTEAYLLQALLIDSPRWQVELFSSWLWQERRDIVRERLPDGVDADPGSVWLRRC